jgi:hypothetical protein
MFDVLSDLTLVSRKRYPVTVGSFEGILSATERLKGLLPLSPSIDRIGSLEICGEFSDGAKVAFDRPGFKKL